MTWSTLVESSLIDPAVSGRLCMTLVHSLWQAPLFALLAWSAGRLWRKESVEAKYGLAVGALVASVLALPLTYVWVEVAPPTAALVTVQRANAASRPASSNIGDLAASPGTSSSPGKTAGGNPSPVIDEAAATPPAAASPAALRAAQPPTTTAAKQPPAWWWRLAPWCALFYVLGVAVMLVRLSVSVWQAQRLDSTARVINSGPLADVLKNLQRQWLLVAVPLLKESERIVVPKVVGLLRPAILLPASALTGLTADEVEMILAHELAHIRRHDMWVNLLQRLAEVVLFVNPAIWWLSRRISTLREYCCDEMTCRAMAGGDTQPQFRYATALLRVAELAQSNRTGGALAALSAAGRSPSELRRRVARLFGEPMREPLRLSRGGLLLVLVIAALLAIGPVVERSVGKDSPASADERKKIVLSEDFAEQTGDILSDLLAEHAPVFLTPGDRRRMCREFVGTVNQFIADHQIDLDTIPAERRRAMLRSLRDNSAVHLRLIDDEANPRSFNGAYLSFPDQWKTLQWEFFMALERGALDDEAHQRQEEQRRWMRELVASFPEDKWGRRKDTLKRLDEWFADPLCTPLDAPMTKEQFVRFRQRVEKYIEQSRAKPRKTTASPFLGFEFVLNAVRVRWESGGKSRFPTFDGDPIDGFGLGGSVMSLKFKSNRDFVGHYGIALDLYEKNGWVMDGATGDVVEAPKQYDEMLEWVETESKGDWGYGKEGIFAVREARLLRLDVGNWLEADKISNAELRKQLETNGSDHVSLDVVEEDDPRIPGHSLGWPYKSKSGVFFGVLTREGKLSVVHVGQYVSPDYSLDLRTRVRPEQTDPAAKSTISGRILLEDGSPATVKGWMYSRIEYGEGNGKTVAMKTEGIYSDTFSLKVHPGTVWLSYFPAEMAPAWVGPLMVKPGQTMNDVTLVLKPGFSASIRVTNKQGEPIPGATLIANPRIEDNTSGPNFEKTTNEKGEFLLEHLADTPYALRVEAPGYEPLRLEPVTLDSTNPHTVQLTQCLKTTGIVQDADLKPIVGAKLYLKHEIDGNGRGFAAGNTGKGFWGKHVATTFGQGRFELDQLARGSYYLFIVETPDGARGILDAVQAGHKIQIVMPKRRDLVVKVTGDLSPLVQRRGKPFVNVRQRIDSRPAPGKGGYGELVGADVPLEATEDGGVARFQGLAVALNPTTEKQQVEVSLGYGSDFRKTVEINADGLTEVEFELPEAKASSDAEKKPTPQKESDQALKGNKALEETSYPITVSGRALDENGLPIEGAEIYLAAGRPGYRRLATTATDKNGAYRFENIPLPIEPANTVSGRDSGTFEVFGIATGYALSWRLQKTFYPKRTHVFDTMPSRTKGEQRTGYGTEDPIELDLSFGQPHGFRGRVVDDRGKPIPNTHIAIRDCDTEWERDEYNATGFDGNLWALNEPAIVPPRVKTRKTDEDGRFEFTGLPADYRWRLEVRPPRNPSRMIYVVTNDQGEEVSESKDGRAIYRNDFEITFARPRKVPFRVIYDDTGEPAPKVAVASSGFLVTTDKNGLASTRLPDGEHKISVSPRYKTPYWRTDASMTVSEESVKQPFTIRLRPAAVVDITVTDADTGEPLSGVDVWLGRTYPGGGENIYREVYGRRSWEVETRISHFDRPRTDKNGKMRVFFEPGKHLIGVGREAYPKGYAPGNVDGREFDCQPGKPTEIEFKLKRLAAQPAGGSASTKPTDKSLPATPSGVQNEITQPSSTTKEKTPPASRVGDPAPTSDYVGQRGPVLRGRILPEDGSPATANGSPAGDDAMLAGTCEPGAAIKLYYYPNWQAKPVLMQETTVDANGRFSIKDAPAAGEEGFFELVATKPGFATVASQFKELNQSGLQLKMRSKTASLSGTITDVNGNPIADATVLVQPYKHPIPGILMAKTDKNGHYNIADLAPWKPEDTRTFDPDTGIGTMVSECPFWVTHPDYPVTRGAYSRVPQEVDITLLPPAVVEGKVVDLASGEPLANVEVQAQGIARDGWFTTKTNADGKYRLRMTSDHYNIWAVAPERMPLAIKALKATQGQRLTGMDIHMTRGGYVVGKVIDPATNRPVDGSQTEIRVGHYGPARPETGAAVTSVKVKADGTYRLHVAPGRNYVYLMNGDHSSVYLKVGDGQTVEHDLVIGKNEEDLFVEDPDHVLGREIRDEARREDEKRATSPTSKPEAYRR